MRKGDTGDSVLEEKESHETFKIDMLRIKR